MDLLLRRVGTASWSWGLSVCLLGALLALAAPAIFGASVAFADDRPPGGNFSNPVVRAVDIAQPAIVRIATLYNVTVMIPACGQTITLPASGSGYVAGGTGSGAFVSSNGDILTADHVVDIPKSDLDAEVLGDPQSQAAQDAADAVNQVCRPSQQLTASDVANGVLQANGINPQIKYSAPQRLAWQDTSYTGPTSSAAPSSFLDGLMSAPHQDATIVASSSFNQNDLAIVHVALSDTPSIQLDNSTSVAVQDQLTIIGFPGNGDVSTSATDLFTPSVNVITVSAIKAGDNGAQLIQVGGNVEHGDSGGPALDAAGHIVGVVSFGGPDAGSTAFLRSSNDALTLISSAGISVHPGTLQTLWQQAFTDYATTSAGHWHKAAAELDAIAANYPAFKGIQPYRDYADRAAQTEAIPASTTTITTAIIAAVGGIVLLLIIGLVIVLVARGRRKSQQPLLAGVAVGVPAGGQQMYYSGGYPTGYPTGYSNGYPQTGYPQTGYPQTGYPQSGYPQSGYSQSGYPQSGYSQSGYPQTGYPQSGYPQSGYPQSGYPQADYGTPPYGGYGEQFGYSQQPAAYGDQVVPQSPVPSTDAGSTPATPATPAQPGAVDAWPYTSAQAPYTMPPDVYTSVPQTPAYTPPVESPPPAGTWTPESGWQSLGVTLPGTVQGQATCVNGHPMAANEVYCALCGAPRASSYPSAPPSAS
jgi:hypothetical protein